MRSTVALVMIKDGISAPLNYRKLKIVTQGVLSIFNNILNLTYCICVFQVFVTYPNKLLNIGIVNFWLPVFRDEPNYRINMMKYTLFFLLNNDYT